MADPMPMLPEQIIQENDHKNRLRALDPTRSFLVHAPAGSGKTTLLTQRFLSLLADCEQHPGEIVALTFTRKAAQEMQERILHALMHPDHHPLAQKALKNKHVRDCVAAFSDPNAASFEHKAPFRIQTIDSFLLDLVSRAPLESLLGAYPDISDRPQSLYRGAVAALFESLGQAAPWAKALERILEGTHQNMDTVQELLVRLLEKREQWLKLIGVYQASAQKADQEGVLLLESYFQKMVQDILEDLACLWTEYQDPWIDAAAIFSYATNEQWPALHYSALSLWRRLADLCITKTGAWRKRLSVQQGFSSEKDLSDTEQKKTLIFYKKQHQLWIKHLEKKDQESTTDIKKKSLRKMLYRLRHLPDPILSQKEKNKIGDYLQLLPVLAAFFWIECQKKGCVDYTEVLIKAIYLLKKQEDLSIFFFHHGGPIYHLLIDEFQDTSVMQYRFFQHMAQESTSLKTLFIVGDPMQSIYGFRGAEVELFDRLKNRGLGIFSLEYLFLSCNFRSQAPLIAWINTVFEKLKPDFFHPAMSGSQSTDRPHLNNPPSTPIHCVVGDQDTLWPALQAHQRAYPHHQIALLARNNKDLQAMIPLLDQHQCPFYTPDRGVLWDSLAMRDLFYLLSYLYDRFDLPPWAEHEGFGSEENPDPQLWMQRYILWRSPWVALSPKALLAYHQEGIGALSPADREKIRVFEEQLDTAGPKRGLVPLAEWLFSVQESLPIRDNSRHLISGSERLLFQALLEKSSIADDCDREALLDRLKDTQISADSPTQQPTDEAQHPPALALMTIHKAKGLEFDAVFLLATDSIKQGSDGSLLTWMDYIPTHQGSEKKGRQDLEQYTLFFMRQHPEEAREEDWFEYIRQERRLKTEEEQKRLLYVALTRAKSHIYWVRSSPLDQSVPATSFAAFLSEEY